LATHYAERVATLSLVSPRPMPELHSLQCPLLVLAGDQGPTAAAADKALVEVPRAASHRLRGYEYLIWSDVMADRGEEIAAAMSNFLDAHALPAVSLLEGEVAGITYRVHGSGPPLVLMPLDLTPSQWEPLIEPLSARYCTICLGGPLLGVVAILEARGRSDYLSVVRTVLDRADIKPGDVVPRGRRRLGRCAARDCAPHSWFQPHHRCRHKSVTAARGGGAGQARGAGRANGIPAGQCRDYPV
jgi:hypothetical protein